MDEYLWISWIIHSYKIFIDIKKRYRRLDECWPGGMDHKGPPFFSTFQLDIGLSIWASDVFGSQVSSWSETFATAVLLTCLFPCLLWMETENYCWVKKYKAPIKNNHSFLVNFFQTSRIPPPPNSKGATTHHPARQEPRSNFFRLSSRLFSSRLYYIHRDWTSAINADHVSWILPCGDEPLELDDHLDKVTSTSHVTNFSKGRHLKPSTLW